MITFTSSCSLELSHLVFTEMFRSSADDHEACTRQATSVASLSLLLLVSLRPMFARKIRAAMWDIKPTRSKYQS